MKVWAKVLLVIAALYVLWSLTKREGFSASGIILGIILLVIVGVGLLYMSASAGGVNTF